jgi:hypothetical protein
VGADRGGDPMKLLGTIIGFLGLFIFCITLITFAMNTHPYFGFAVIGLTLFWVGYVIETHS